MFDKIIAYSVENKFVICLLVAALSIWGVYSIQQIPIDAVPDITNNQIQIITISPTLATQEVEQFITTPIELALQNLQNTEEIRSISTDKCCIPHPIEVGSTDSTLLGCNLTNSL